MWIVEKTNGTRFLMRQGYPAERIDDALFAAALASGVRIVRDVDNDLFTDFRTWWDANNVPS
jgi:hypothetical protein